MSTPAPTTPAPGTLTMGDVTATPNANVTPAQTQAAQSAGWKPAVEPTVLSTQGGKTALDGAVADHTTTVASLPSSNGSSGTSNSNGSQGPTSGTDDSILTPEEAKAAGIDVSQGYTFNSDSGYFIKNDSTNSEDQFSADKNTINTAFNNQIQNFTAAETNLVGSLNQLYSSRMQDQEAVNAANLASTNTQNIRGGTSRYAGGVANSIFTGEENAGLQKLNDIATQQASAIASASDNLQKENYQAFLDNQKQISDLTTQRTAQLNKLHDLAVAENDKNQATIQKNKDTMDTIAEDAAKGGAPKDIIAAITSAKTPGDAINAAGQYLQASSNADIAKYLFYKNDAISKGLTPQDFNSYTNSQTYNAAYDAAAAKVAADKASGVLSTQDATAVNNVISQLNSNTQVKTFQETAATYGVIASIPDGTTDPTQQSTLIAQVAHMLSPASTSLRGALGAIDPSSLQSGMYNKLNSIQQEFTAKGTLSPSSVDALKSIAKGIYSNQASVYGKIRSDAIAPLSGARGISNADSYVPDYSDLGASAATTDYKGQVNDYITSNPADAPAVANLYKVPGATDQSIYAYLVANGKITQ